MTNQTDETEGRIYSVIEVAVHPEAAFWEITTLRTQLAAANARADRAEAALTPQPSPDVAALVEAAEKLLDAYSAIVGAGNSWGDELRAALARVKGGEA